MSFIINGLSLVLLSATEIKIIRFYWSWNKISLSNDLDKIQNIRSDCTMFYPQGSQKCNTDNSTILALTSIS